MGISGEGSMIVTRPYVISTTYDLVTRSGHRLIEGVEELAKSDYTNVFDN